MQIHSQCKHRMRSRQSEIWQTEIFSILTYSSVDWADDLCHLLFKFGFLDFVDCQSMAAVHWYRFEESTAHAPNEARSVQLCFHSGTPKVDKVNQIIFANEINKIHCSELSKITFIWIELHDIRSVYGKCTCRTCFCRYGPRQTYSDGSLQEFVQKFEKILAQFIQIGTKFRFVFRKRLSKPNDMRRLDVLNLASATAIVRRSFSIHILFLHGMSISGKCECSPLAHDIQNTGLAVSWCHFNGETFVS